MIKVISCGVFEPYINGLNVSNIDIVYLEINQHSQPKRLASLIQQEIDISVTYDKIIILYGLCGGVLLGLRPRTIPVYIVKVHDCLAVLLGSKGRYKTLFKDRLSTSWSCLSLKESNSLWVDPKQIAKWKEIYDEETLNYLVDKLAVEPSVYISMNLEDESKYYNDCEVIIGNKDMLFEILNLNSSELMILTDEIIQSEDFDEVIKIKGETHGNFE